MTMTPEDLKQLTINALEDIKASDIVVIDMRELSSMTDYMIICSGRSSRHLHSIADSVALAAKNAGQRPLSVEGKNSRDWVLVDLGDVIVHVMMPETREFYALEKLWSE